MSDTLDTLIIGAGVVGAAVAYAMRGRDVVLVDAAPRFGSGISSRNSGVVHAGLYYPQDSLKTRLCRRGAQLLYAFCDAHAVPCRRTGKYIVATDDDQCDQLDWLLANNAGAVPLHETGELPDGVRAKRAVFSPNSGIVDIHIFIERLLEQSGAEVVYQQRVTAIRHLEQGVEVQIDGEWLRARQVINCAGLNAPDFCDGYRTYYARGAYFQVKLPNDRDVPHLVYPAVPKKSAYLGVHLTRNIHGEAYLGPDIEWIDQEDYRLDETRLQAFYKAASPYLPWLTPQHLQPGYTGIRPKLADGEWRDFILVQDRAVIHCLGIESPGITAALAIGEHVAQMGSA